MAPTKSLFRLLIVISQSCGIFAVVLDQLTLPYLPLELQRFISQSLAQMGERE